MDSCTCTCHLMGGQTCTDCDHLHNVTPPPAITRESLGSKDGTGSCDGDKPFEFGNRPTTEWPRPFSQSEFARLLIMRGRVRAEREAA